MNREPGLIKQRPLHRDSGRHRNRSSKWAPCRVCMLVLATMAAVTVDGCKDDDRRGAVSQQPVEFAYPPVEVREARIQKYSNEFGQSEPVQNVDSLLRRIVEEVPLRYARTYLGKLAQEHDTSERPNIPILLARMEELQNLNHDDAPSFVMKAVEDGNVDILCVALLFGLRTQALQTEAAEGLSELKDPKAVRALSIRLCLAASLGVGGTQSQLLRYELREALVDALSKCTSLNFPDYDPASESKTADVLKQCQEWLNKRL